MRIICITTCTYDGDTLLTAGKIYEVIKCDGGGFGDYLVKTDIGKEWWFTLGWFRSYYREDNLNKLGI